MYLTTDMEEINVGTICVAKGIGIAYKEEYLVLKKGEVVEIEEWQLNNQIEKAIKRKALKILPEDEAEKYQVRKIRADIIEAEDEDAAPPKGKSKPKGKKDGKGSKSEEG